MWHRAVALGLSLSLAACQPAGMRPPPPSAGVPAVQNAAGTLAGGYLGDRLGAAFGEKARLEAAQAERRALAGDAPVRWSEPEAQASGEVVLLRDFTDAAGRPCREYSHHIRVAGHSDSGSGIACRGSDGRWELVGG